MFIFVFVCLFHLKVESFKKLYPITDISFFCVEFNFGTFTLEAFSLMHPVLLIC